MATRRPPIALAGQSGIWESVLDAPNKVLAMTARRMAETKGQAMQMILLVRLDREGKTVETQ
jgi:hypothetical protein